MSDTNNLRDKFKDMEYTCCICGKTFIGFGNNPSPVNNEDGKLCCNFCNNEVVIPARLNQMRFGGK